MSTIEIYQIGRKNPCKPRVESCALSGRVHDLYSPKPDESRELQLLPLRQSEDNSRVLSDELNPHRYRLSCGGVALFGQKNLREFGFKPYQVRPTFGVAGGDVFYRTVRGGGIDQGEMERPFFL